MVAKTNEKKPAKVASKVATKKASENIKKVVAETKSEVKKDVVAKKVEKKVEVKDKKTTMDKMEKVVLKGNVIRQTGKRKMSIAKVACFVKDGEKIVINVNDLDYRQYFTKLINQKAIFAPFALLGIKLGYKVEAEVFGGGKTGQADAIKLGLSKCLALFSEEYSTILRKNSFLTRDARRVEPKKYGLKKARKKEQFSKR